MPTIIVFHFYSLINIYLFKTYMFLKKCAIVKFAFQLCLLHNYSFVLPMVMLK